jgi:hypothetical protein
VPTLIRPRDWHNPSGVSPTSFLLPLDLDKSCFFSKVAIKPSYIWINYKRQLISAANILETIRQLDVLLLQACPVLQRDV